jgi:hypothetical protein
MVQMPMSCELAKTALGVCVLDCLEHTFTAQTFIVVCPSLASGTLLDRVNLRHCQTVFANFLWSCTIVSSRVGYKRL